MPDSRSPSPIRAARGTPWDRLGVLISGLCMVHCVAGLVLVGMLGLGGGLLLNPAIHHVGLIAAIVIAGATIGANALRGGARLPLVAGLTGLSLMTAAVVSAHGTAEALLTIAGVALVAFAHITNLRHNH